MYLNLASKASIFWPASIPRPPVSWVSYCHESELKRSFSRFWRWRATATERSTQRPSWAESSFHGPASLCNGSLTVIRFELLVDSCSRLKLRTWPAKAPKIFFSVNSISTTMWFRVQRAAAIYAYSIIIRVTGDVLWREKNWNGGIPVANLS